MRLTLDPLQRPMGLLDSTLRQVYLQRLLNFPQPRYLHLPVAVNALGEKLSKQTLAPQRDITRPQPTLVSALNFLNHPAPQALHRASTLEIRAWAAQNWRVARILPGCSKEPEI